MTAIIPSEAGNYAPGTTTTDTAAQQEAYWAGVQASKSDVIGSYQYFTDLGYSHDQAMNLANYDAAVSSGDTQGAAVAQQNLQYMASTGSNTLPAGGTAPQQAQSADTVQSNPNQFGTFSGSGSGATGAATSSLGSTGSSPAGSSGAPQFTYNQLSDPAAEAAASAAGQTIYWKPPGSSTYEAVPYGFNTAQYGNDNALYTRTAAPAPGVTTDQQSAQTTIDGILSQYGLSSLSNWAWGEITNGATAAQVQLDLYNQPAFQQRFPAIGERAAKGLPPITPAQYIAYENTANELGAAAGLPTGFMKSYTDALIANDVSTSEINDRLQKGLLDVTNAPPDVVNQFQQYYGISQGDLAAHFLDPTQSLPYLEKQAQAAKLGAAAVQSSFGNINESQAMNLANLNVTSAQAKAGFTKLGTMSQLMTGLPGTQEQNISQDVQLGAEFAGNTQDQNIIAQRQRNRVAAMHSGGTFGESTHGVEGLGTVGQAV